MIWAIGIVIWLVVFVLAIAFVYGAFGPDTETERERDWEGLQKHMKERRKDVE